MAQYEQAVNHLNYTNLYASCDGVVKSVDAEVGQVVGPGVVTSRPQVVTIVQEGEREVEISVPENRLDELRKEQKIQVKFWALPDVIIDGRFFGWSSVGICGKYFLGRHDLADDFLGGGGDGHPPSGVPVAPAKA